MIQLSPKLAALISPRASPRLAAIRMASQPQPQPPPMMLDDDGSSASSGEDSSARGRALSTSSSEDSSARGRALRTSSESCSEDCCSKSCSCADETDASSISHLELEDYASEGDPDSEDDTLYSVMDDLKRQMATLHAASLGIAGQMPSLYERAKEADISWYEEPLEIRDTSVRDWVAKKKLPNTPTLRDFIDACFDSAISLDLESRVLQFTKEDAAALWGGQRRITIFEVIGRLPILFL